MKCSLGNSYYIVFIFYEQSYIYVNNTIITGTSSRDSLLSWIRLLEKHGNPLLSSIPVIFTLTAPPNDVTVQETQPATQEDSKSEKADNSL